ncbi:DUF3152 domain-containing protein [Streptomyces sp. NPDC001744]|uniref:DUF3152 domain-containing protein n=1 Tax=Streptomyces sp. NPDC001744 TaxID=3364606 RepID=UPI0036A570FF
MGRHSRKGSASPVADTGRRETDARPGTEPEPAAGQAPGTGRRRRPATGDGRDRTGTPAHGTPDGGSGAPGTPAHGTPVHGGPGSAPGSGGPRHGTPAHGTPAFGRAPARGDSGRGTATVRGGHPQHDEEGGPRPAPYAGRRGAARPPAPEGTDGRESFVPGPRPGDGAEPDPGTGSAPGPGTPAGRNGLGRTLAGVAAAAVATVLAVVVAGQVTDRGAAPSAARAAGGPAERAADDASASRSDDRSTPALPTPAQTPAPTYEQLMTRQFPIDPKLKGSGVFEVVPGFQKAPGRGRLIRYRVDVEKGLGLDPRLFADAVQKTLNDRRSWAGDGAMTFERVSSGEARFVITLASPGTTGDWCRKSGLDTTVDNVSCDSASTERVMINAFRWAQGAVTFGPKAMYAYRQMLINHEVGHRLGHGHELCRTPGALAPVMQQQTKSLDIDGISCRPNPWVHPGS